VTAGETAFLFINCNIKAMEVTLIHSVLGFNRDIEITDQYGETIKTGARTIYPTVMLEQLQYKILDKNVFTHYNQGLLDKIRDCRRNID
jgi:hypothetical protein